MWRVVAVFYKLLRQLCLRSSGVRLHGRQLNTRRLARTPVSSLTGLAASLSPK